MNAINPKIVATAFLVLVALGVAAYVAFGKKGRTGDSSRRGGGRNGDRKPVSGFLNPGATGEVELYVGNLSFDMTDSQLRAEFAKFGIVAEAHVVTNRDNGRSKGFGFVTMPHRSEAAVAVKALDNAEIMGRRLRVNEARGNKH